MNQADFCGREGSVGLFLAGIFSFFAISLSFADFSANYDAGATRVGMYAVIGKVADATAIYHNIANLASNRGSEVYFSSLICYPIISFKLSSIDPQSGETVYTKANKPNLSYAGFPYFGVISDLGLLNWRFGIANYLPNLGGGNFSQKSDLRYHLVKGFSFTDYTSFAAAKRINHQLYLGASLDLIYAFEHGYRMLNLYKQVPPPYNELFKDLSDLKVKAEMEDLTLGYHLSLLYLPADGVKMGFSYFEQSNLTLSGDMTFKTTNNQTIPILGIREYTTKTELGTILPRTIKLGFNFQINPRWNWGLDIYFVDSSVIKYEKQSFPNMGDDPVGRLMAEFLGEKIKIPKNYGDSYEIAAGAEYQVNTRWKVRFGMEYDQSPVPDETFSLDNFTSDLIGGACGFEYRMSQKSLLAMGFEYAYMFRREIKRSYTEPPTTGKVIFSDAALLLFEINHWL